MFDYITLQCYALCMTTIENWKIQLRKGYLELCLLMIINNLKQVYGFDLIEKLQTLDLNLKEGTLYPMLNRMAADGVLTTFWDTQNHKGHPRKFYSLTKKGSKILNEMQEEFEKIQTIFKQLQRGNHEC